MISILNIILRPLYLYLYYQLNRLVSGSTAIYTEIIIYKLLRDVFWLSKLANIRPISTHIILHHNLYKCFFFF